MFQLNEEEVRSNLAAAPSTRTTFEQTLESIRSSLKWKLEAYREQKAEVGKAVSQQHRSLLEATKQQLKAWIVADQRHICVLEKVLSGR
jgi:hypothetical protein